MSTMRKAILVSLISFVFLLCLYVIKSWTIWEYKYGSNPIFINIVNDTDDKHDKPRGKTLLLKNNSKKISDLKIGLTDFYYLEGANSISFGIWYNKWHYNAVDKLFHITLKDNNGQIYETYFYTNMPSVGVYENFQIREFRDVDLNQIESLSISISLEADEANVVTTEIFNTDKSILTEVK